MKNLRQPFLLFLLLLSLFAFAQVPVLNSNPSSRAVIFLDFDGHVVEGTSWNGSGAFVCDKAALDAAQITTVFNRVAEDYRPFTVNVTTDSAKYEAAPAGHRMRVVLTVSSSWYGSAGGVAYIGSFTWGDNTPCFVFTALLNNNLKYIAEAASHEAGHTLGLRHQSSYDAMCNKTGEYNVGIGSGEISWAPIMGVGYYKNMTLWNYGANPYGCNSIQDDLSIITDTENAITYRADDFGNTSASAVQASFIANRFSAGGIIEQPGDVDAFRFTTVQPGRFTLEALPYAVATGNTGANIDLQLELRDIRNNLVGTYNAEALLNASIDTMLAAGTYFVTVQGRGNVFAPNYASLGSYTINASVSPNTALPLHKLLLTGIAEGRQHKLSWEIVADERIVSQTLETASGSGGFEAKVSPEISGRSFGCVPPSNGVQYYRLAVTFDNGRRYYSNTVALRNGNDMRPSLMGNVTSGPLTVSSPGACAYTIVDMNGRSVANGNLVPGTSIIYPALPSAGVYLIRFAVRGEHYTEKFSKQ